MRTRERIAKVFAEIGTNVRDMVTDTQLTYCPTIQPSTFQASNLLTPATEKANFAAQAFDSMAIIYGQSRRAFNHRRDTRAYLGHLRRLGIEE
jgi:hypothetical protein